MIGKTWIQLRLVENNFNTSKVYKLYDRYINETGLTPSKETYRRKVRQYLKELKTFVISQIKDVEDLNLYSKEQILSILEEEIKKKNKILSIDDIVNIAKERKIPLKVFFYHIPDLMNTIKSIYSSMGFMIDYDIKIQKLSNRLKDVENEKKILLKKEAEISAIIESLSSIINEYKPLPAPNIIKEHKERTRVGVICLSDTHFDEIVSLPETFFLNEYNPKIAKERIDIVLNGVIEWCQELKINKLYIKFLGDMVSGIIHEELIKGAELGVTNSVIQLADYLAQWIVKLSEYFKEINVLAMAGNHGRLFLKPYFKHKQVLNFDYILYEFIKREVKNIVKSFIIPDSFIYVGEILGYKFLTLHGDIFRGGTGLNPVSGTIGRDLAKLNGLLRANNKEFDYAEFGHFHHGESVLTAFDGTVFFMNGSLIGGSEYSIGAVKRADRPSQNFYVVEKGKGVLFKTPIYADGK